MGIGVRLGPISVRSSGRGSDLFAEGLGYILLAIAAGGAAVLITATALAGLVGVAIGFLYFLSYPGGGARVWGSALLRWFSILGLLEGLGLVAVGVVGAVGALTQPDDSLPWWFWLTVISVSLAMGIAFLAGSVVLRRTARRVYVDPAPCRRLFFWLFSLALTAIGPLVCFWSWSSAIESDFDWFVKVLVVASGVGMLLPTLVLTFDDRSTPTGAARFGRAVLWLLTPVAINAAALKLVGLPPSISELF